MRFTAARSQAISIAGKEQLRKDRAAARPLRDTFPRVASIRIELVFREADTVAPAAQSHTLHPPARAFFEFPCPHADCDGRLNLSVTVERLVLQSARDFGITLVCPGVRSKGAATKSPCGLEARCSLAAEYLASAGSDD